MQILFKIILLVLKTFIKIGDFVLFFIKKITSVVKISYGFIIKSLHKVVFKFNIISSYFVKNNHLNKIVIKKNKRKRMITVFPLPFGIKLRYFFLGSFFSLIFIFLPSLFFIFLQELPSPKIMSFGQISQTSKIYDRNGNLLYQIYASENRTVVPLSSIPKDLQNATIAIEDKEFYKHPGFDVTAITRSLISNFSTHRLQGGSTITQQLIKSVLLTPETTFKRKLKEIILAFWAERIYSKNQILEMYLNQVPYGGTAWGAETASEVYFGKKIQDLNLAQSAFLAGIPRAPTIYSPFGNNPALGKKRQKEVLNRMVELGFITKEKAIEAANEELDLMTPQTPIHAPHFVMYVKDLLVKKYGLPMVEKGGLNVVTSLDLRVQNEAQKIVEEEVNNNAYLNLTNGASLVIRPKNGDILAMIGSKDYSDPNSGNVNLTNSLRQPGSSIKVVTYAAALSKGFTPATILDDSPITYYYQDSPSYSPVNYDGKFHGKVSLRTAFANSFNIPAVKVLNQIGVTNMINLGKKMGIESWNEPQKYGLSITLGGADLTMVELATVYNVFANQGEKVDLNPILKITDPKGNTLEEKIYTPKERIVDKGIAFVISDILSDNLARSWEFGTNSPLNIPNHTVSVKTGTSDDKRDNWTIGYTPSYLVAAWVGNNDNSPMSQNLASGITGAAPIWNKIMTMLLTNMPDEKFSAPSDVIQKDCLGRKEYFIKGTENSVNCILLPTPTPTPTPNH